MRALGIDVSVTRGLDAVVLDDAGSVVLGPLKAETRDLADLVSRGHPDVVAIDSPPAWGTDGRSRLVERQLLALGISIYATPQDPGEHRFYRWMRAGFEVFAAAAEVGYSLYRGGSHDHRQAIEVFPHASAVTLRGHLPEPGQSKLLWRRQVLADAGVDHRPLTTLDQVDAALAALTGLRFRLGAYCVVGQPGEAVLVLPVADLPSVRYRPLGAHGVPAIDL